MTLAWPEGWPRTPDGRRVRGNFSYQGTTTGYGGNSYKVKRDITVAMAYGRVQEEVRRMGGTGLRIDTDMPTRNDGLPYSQARQPDDPGCVVSFRLPGGRPVVFPCDRYGRVEMNLAAVAATLEAKRAIERHGVSTLEREFEGYAALPSGDAAKDAAAASAQGHRPASPTIKVPPHVVLGIAEGAPIEVAEAAWKALAKKHHPDVGGDEAKAAEVNAAIARIREATK